MNNHIEIYKNALPDDVCNSLISIFDRENVSELGSKVTQSKTFWGERKDLYSALELGLDDINYHYKEFIDEYILDKFTLITDVVSVEVVEVNSELEEALNQALSESEYDEVG